ncbi:MAG: YbaN family protein [Rhodospirillales bacterium]|jgi:hypothetical protein|nr:YbaN family protein [Rhodospirillales bacterium]HJO73397.1 YbaN family protein [Rhodospirillales bacterium]
MTPANDNWEVSPDAVRRCAGRWLFLAFGWLNVAVGMIGVVVPGLPTTVFLIIALWAFTNSSERFRTWLWDHPRFGPPLRAWHRHRVIPLKAKVLAVASMTMSFILVTAFAAESWALPAAMVSVMMPIAAYLLTRASAVPVPARVPVRTK